MARYCCGVLVSDAEYEAFIDMMKMGGQKDIDPDTEEDGDDDHGIVIERQVAVRISGIDIDIATKRVLGVIEKWKCSTEVRLGRAFMWGAKVGA